MKDANRALREAVFELLDGNLDAVINGSTVDVPVYDEMLQEAAPVYVIIGNQTKSSGDNFRTFVHDCTIVLDIVHKSTFDTTKDVVDDVSDQIGGLMTSTPGTSNLPAITGFQFTSLTEDAVTYVPTIQTNDGYVIRKIVTYRCRVVET